MTADESKVAITLGAIVGAIATPFFIFLAFFASAICFDSTYARLLYPYSVVIVPRVFDRFSIVLLTALIQWPIYGGIVGWIYSMRRREVRLWAVWGLSLILLHWVVMIIAAWR